MNPLKSFILFLRHTHGTINSPYATFREISLEKKDLGQVIFIYLLIILYFFLGSLFKLGYQNPFLLTIKFNSLLFSTFTGFLLMLSFFYFASRLFQVKNFRINRLIILWSYSLWPTLSWFFFTTLMYFILPPPRTFSILGKLYSLSYLALSLTLLFWKLILYYLTLRFGLRLDLAKIFLLSLIIFPALFIYSFIMHKMSIFKIPFI